MARRLAKVSEEIVAINEAAFFYPSDLVNTKTTNPLRVGEERWIYTETRSVEALFTSPSGDSCIVFLCSVSVFKDWPKNPAKREVAGLLTNHEQRQSPGTYSRVSHSANV